MSALTTLSKDLSNFDQILEPYRTDYLAASSDIAVKGKTLQQCLKEQGSLPAYYGERKAELSALTKKMESMVDAVRGSLYVKYTENHSRELKERDKERYIDREPTYISMHGMFLEAKEWFDKYTEVCDAFRIRGFALRDLVAARTHAFQDMDL